MEGNDRPKVCDELSWYREIDIDGSIRMVIWSKHFIKFMDGNVIDYLYVCFCMLFHRKYHIIDGWPVIDKGRQRNRIACRKCKSIFYKTVGRR